jgi:Ser/Thr protein kinase RdoA (MazF antagonist)
MRNFSTLSKAHFVSYTVNGGEYVGNDIDISDVLGAIAAAFETPFSKVKAAYSEALAGFEESDHLTPSEFRVLVDLMMFEALVRNKLSPGHSMFDDESHSFMYINLNTGKTVSWILFMG